MEQEQTQEQKDAAELSRHAVHLSQARVQMADLERERTALRRDVETLTANLRKRRDELKAEIAALQAERDRAREETAGVQRELQAAQAERGQARDLIRRATALRVETDTLQGVRDRVAAEVLEHRAMLEADTDRHRELGEKHAKLAAQVADAEATLKARHAEKAAVEHETAKARKTIDEEQLALRTVKTTHQEMAERLANKQEKLRVTETRLVIHEKALEEREHGLAILQDEARAKVSGIAQREAVIAHGAAELAQAKLAFQQESEPKLIELRRLAAELEVQEQSLRDQRARIDAEQQELRVNRSKLEIERGKLSKAQTEVQNHRNEFKRVVKQFGLEGVLGHTLAGD